MEKYIGHKALINLKIYAGIAKPNPKMGQSLGPLGINMMHFCKDFNNLTQHIRTDVPLRVQLMAFEDRTYKFIIKPPETSWFLRKATGKNKFTKLAGHVIQDEVNIKHIYEIAKVKQEMDIDLKHVTLESICKQIIGQCTTMGVKVVLDRPAPTPFIPKLSI